MAYFNHAFRKILVGTKFSQSYSAGVSVKVDHGYVDITAGVPTVNGQTGVQSVNLVQTAAPFALGVGSFGLFSQQTNNGNGALLAVGNSSTEVINGIPLYLVSTALYQNDKIGPFAGGYQETTKSKLINPRYVSNFNRIDPVTANQNVIHIGTTPFTKTGTSLTPALGTNTSCAFQFLCDETYYLRIDVKGSPELRALSRNGYWTVDYYTGCCAAGCIAPTPVDSTLAMIGWATQIMNSRIVGPFIMPVVYDQLGGAWYAPGTTGEYFDNVAKPGISSLAITNGGTLYTDGTYYNVIFQGLDGTPNNGAGATATVTVSGGVITTVVVETPGLGYSVGDVLRFPQLEQGEAGVLATFTVTGTAIPTWDNYVSPGYITGKTAGMSLTGAFVDTRFGDCTFYPSDFFEKQPVNIYASMVDEIGNPCTFSSICVETQCLPRQAMGLGEEVLRDLILSESYMQNYFNTSKDLRIREVTQGYDVTNAIQRANLYTRYQILHNVPRLNNPSGMFDNDRYLLDVITNGISSAFETAMKTWLGAAGTGVTLTIYAPVTAACPAACGAWTFATYATETASGAVSKSLAATMVGGGSYVYEITNGTFGTCVINATTGLLTGTAPVAGTYSFTLAVTDQTTGCSQIKVYTVVVS